MPRQNAPLFAFNRGEVSKIALGRVDLTKLQLSAECQLNWEPRVVGPMMLRTGYGFIGEIRNSNKGRLLPFIFSKLDTALLEITDSVLRVWINDVLVMRVAVSTTVSDPNFNGGGTWTTANTTAGATATIAGGSLTLVSPNAGGLAQAQQAISVADADHGKEHGIRIVVANGPVTVRAGTSAGEDDLIGETVLDTGTHALACTPTGDIVLQIESTDAWSKSVTSVTIDGAGALEIPTPWDEDDIPTVRYSESGDVIFVASYGLRQYKIERRALHGWSVVLYRSSNGPFEETNGTDTTLTPAALSGNTSLTSTRSLFRSGHVGSLFRLFSSGQNVNTTLSAENTFTNAIRVSGVSASRLFTYAIGGTWVGTLTLQRSFDSATTGFIDVSSRTSNTSTQLNDGLDNSIAWYRIGFKTGDYTSGSASITMNYAGGAAAGICRVTSISSDTVANVEVLSIFSSLTPTTDWQEDSWSGELGFPTAVGFFEGRLTWTGRDKMWFSQSNNYTGFAQEDNQAQSLGDAGAIVESFGEGPVDSVNWVLSLTRPLFGREMSIASARSSSFDEPLTPDNFSVKDCATQGAERLWALKIDKGGIYIQQSGRRVYELLFDAQAMDYSAHDLTRLNLDIGVPGFASAAVARQPDTMCFFPRNDGLSANLLYDRDDEVVAWWRSMTLGLIEDVCVLPAASGPEDLVYFIVRRFINGTWKRFIEKAALRDDCKGGLINRQLDSHLVYDGDAADSISLPHLPNTQVSVWADGKYIGDGLTDADGLLSPLPDGRTHSKIVAGLGGATKTYSGDPVTSLTGLSNFEGLPCEVFADQQPTDRMVRVGTFTVTDGKIDLPPNWQASNIVAFFGYVAPFMSAKLAYAAAQGSPLTQRKKIDHLGIVLYDTHAKGITYGQRFDDLDPMPEIEAGAPVVDGTVWSEYDEPMFELDGDWNTDARVCLLAQAPYPATCGGLVVSQDTSG